MFVFTHKLAIFKNIIFVGICNKECDLVAENVRTDETGCTFSVRENEYSINLAGEHNVYNALCAVAAGKLLDKYLDAVDIPREDVYIANILKCRPPKNRDPKPEEEDMCIDYLREQVMAIRPKVIVCLGRISAMRIIKPDFKITAEHGKWFDKNGYSVCAVYHPAALLRDPRKKDEMLADMMAIKRRLEGVE